MNMKFMAFMAMFMMSIGIVSAVPSPPFPVDVIIKYQPDNTKIEVDVTNLDTGETMSGFAFVYEGSSFGEFKADFGNSKEGYHYGDRIQISVPYLGEEDIIEITDQPGIMVKYEYTQTDCPVCDCPTTVTTTTVTTTTTTPTTCPVCPEPADYNLEVIFGALFAILGGVGAAVYIKRGKVMLKKKGIDKIIEAMPRGTGLRITRAYNGKGSIKHWHRSPITYHDIKDRHRPEYDHNGDKNLFPDF